MKLRLKEDPREWRKSTWFTVGGLALVGSLLRWRHVLAQPAWLWLLLGLVLVALCAWLAPRWFRGYYRFSTRAGYWSSLIFASVLLTLLFFLLFTPLALLFRLLGKDALRLKRPNAAASYWQTARETSPLDRQF